VREDYPLRNTHYAIGITQEFRMYTKTDTPPIIIAAGNTPKKIEEYVGRVATGNQQVSIARMISPGGWLEPAQIPEFDEYSIVLRGELHARIDDGETIVLTAGQAISLKAGVKVQYSTPGEEGAEYLSVCLPAFGPDTAHRQE
jgi:quercetin dioxygenase-like cupin family protein